MGNVKSQHLKSTDKRASYSSDHPCFYNRRWSSYNKPEGYRKNTLELNDTRSLQQPIEDSASEIHSVTENLNGGKMTDVDAGHRTFQHTFHNRPKSFPAMPSTISLRKSHPHHSQDISSKLDNNSTSENDISRRTQMHYLLKYYFQGKYKAPIQELLRQPSSFLCENESIRSTDPVRILDICCGSGEWILEMAAEYPNVQCYGVSPTDTYPTMVKPPNAHFSCCDVAHSNTVLEFSDNYFDFVRMEMIYKSYNKNQWKILVKELSRVLKTGGYFELRDVDPIMKHTGPFGNVFFEQYANLVKKILDVDMDWYKHMCDYMEKYGGMTDIHFQEAMLPMGWGPGQVPQILLRLIEEGLKSHEQVWLDLSDNSDSELLLNTDKTNRILEEAIQNHAYYNFYLCWGRKPYFPQMPTVGSTVYESSPPKKESNSEILTLVNGYDE